MYPKLCYQKRDCNGTIGAKVLQRKALHQIKHNSKVALRGISKTFGFEMANFLVKVVYKWVFIFATTSKYKSRTLNP